MCTVDNSKVILDEEFYSVLSNNVNTDETIFTLNAQEFYSFVSQTILELLTESRELYLHKTHFYLFLKTLPHYQKIFIKYK